ncbi:hypothetical protein, partial [Amaricoccus sp. W119]|uniref:hypothetical protein n=1 Tax=Amaricoccus sp. W119 TaxID=3391833 RepID=UPI0039A6D9BC
LLSVRELRCLHAIASYPGQTNRTRIFQEWTAQFSGGRASTMPIFAVALANADGPDEEAHAALLLGEGMLDLEGPDE